jgi:flagellar assembly protein FliH
LAHIPKEQQTAFQRWEMKSFGDERPSSLAARQREEEAAAQAAAAAATEAAAEAAARQAEYEAELNAPPPPQYPTEEELAALREEARQQGYEDGYKAGHAEGQRAALDAGRAATEQLLAPMEAIGANFAEALRGADQAISSEVLELALHLARDMLRTALPVRPEMVIPIVREAVEYLPSLQQPAVLALNPEDAAVVREAIGEELDKDGWRVVEDPTIERGGCKVDTATNQIDATVQGRWTRLTHALGKDLDWLG